jgi:hypothetical protein
MKKVVVVFGILLVVGVNVGLGERLAVLGEVERPNGLVVDGEWVYVAEGTGILVYSRQDYRLKKRFGQAGEGAEEFLGFAAVLPWEGQLLVNSPGKISYYTRDGNFLKELKAGDEASGVVFFPLKKGFVGLGLSQEEDTQYLTIDSYDEKLDKGQTLYRLKSPTQQSGKIELLKRAFAYQVHDNKIYIIGQEGFAIEVLDHTGKLLLTIRQKDYQRRRFTPRDEKAFRDFLKLRLQSGYEYYQDRFAFPEYFPEISSFFVGDGRLYVLTWKVEDEKIELYIFDTEGKPLKHLFVPFKFQNALEPYPWAIKAGTLYQLIANKDGEWELQATSIE